MYLLSFLDERNLISFFVKDEDAGYLMQANVMCLSINKKANRLN